MTKYCVNCKHFRPKLDDEHHEFARCSVSTRNNPTSLVTGQPKANYLLPYCEVMRFTGDDKCGPDALFYEETTNV